jgi:hypothetical protein
MSVRDVEIVPVSARDELLVVVRAAMAIIAAVWLYAANNPFPSSGGGVAERSLLPFQTAVQSLPADGQRMFRELQVSLLEAETIRSAEGVWPDAARLIADGIEPFAPNPSIKGAAYEWTMIRNGRLIQYLGRPGARGGSAWLVTVQEPDPAAPPEVFVDDEEHDRLLDGSILHVAIWTHADGDRVSERVVPVPQAEGWIQLYAAAPRSPAPNV